MLPDSTQIRNNLNRAKFADTGMEDLLKLMVSMGADPHRLVAKIAGGAQMFASSGISDALRVGERNVEAAKKQLAMRHIRLLAEDTGLNYGRTVEFYSETGDYVIKAVGKGIKTI
jgi:chemotaxis protein CheD